MLKKCLALIILFTAGLSLYSTPIPDVSRTISLQGAYGDVLSIDVEVFAAQVGMFKQGMPFDIQDSSVQYDVYHGRPIAHWSMLANTPFKVRVKADKLAHVSSGLASDVFDYILTFTYNLSYNENSKPIVSANSGEFEYHTESSIECEYELAGIENADRGSFIGSVDGTIFFRFEDGMIDLINAASSGNYDASVTVTLEALE